MGDQTDLNALVRLKQTYDNVLLYIDEAHAFGVRGKLGLGCAEETGCIGDIDFLVGTFGKAAASSGAYIVCRQVIREYLINRMRTLIFTTALPPLNIAWTLFMIRKMASMQKRREHLAHISQILRDALIAQGYECPSVSHIVPMIVGSSKDTILRAEYLQRPRVLCPARPSAYGTGRYITYPFLADSRDKRRRNGATEKLLK